MFTNVKCSIYAGQDKVYTESVCLSTDVKPTTGIANGSTCIEMNTGKKFMFNEDSGEWVEVPSSGGGGGGGGGDSDFSTAQVTFINIGGDGTSYNVYYCAYIDDTLGITYKSVSDPLYVETQETLTIPLYKGKASIPVAFSNIDQEVMPTFTGNVSFNETYTNLVITGNGTMSAVGNPIL